MRMMIGGGFLVLTAVVLLFDAMGSYFHTRSFLRKAIKVDGIVRRIVSGEKPNIHYAVYGFRDPSIPLLREVFSDVGVHPAPPNTQFGDPVTLLYLPEDPTHGIRPNFWNLWGTAVKLGACGLIALLAGGGVLFAARSY